MRLMGGVRCLFRRGRPAWGKLTKGLASRLSDQGSNPSQPGQARRCKLTGKDRIERELRVSRILTLGLKGLSLRQIGELENSSVSPQAIWKALKNALDGMVVESLEQIRRHCHINRFYCPLLGHRLDSESINSTL
jgi:hypothetical protein